MENSYCTNCGQLIQADANFCSGCGKPKSSTIGEVRSHSDEEAKIRVETDALRVVGLTGQIDVCDGVISITRKGLRGTLSQGQKGEQTIPVHSVTRVDYKKPSLLVNGHIHFLVEGEKEHGSLNCPRTVVFRGREQEEDFERMAALVNKLKGEVAVQRQGMVESVTREEPPVEQSGEARKDIQAASSACCPHCGVTLDPVPRGKKKCPSCRNDIYVKTDPRSQRTLLVKQEDALRLDALRKEAAAGMRAVRKMNLEKEFEEAERKAPQNQTTRSIVWALLNDRKQKAARSSDRQTMSSVSLAQARLLYELGEDYFALLQVSMKEELQHALATGVVRRAQIVTSRDDRVCEKCKSLDRKVFTIGEAMDKMPLPVKCDSEEGWCRCAYVYD